MGDISVTMRMLVPRQLLDLPISVAIHLVALPAHVRQDVVLLGHLNRSLSNLVYVYGLYPVEPLEPKLMLVL
jgi:hypothetical protein